MGIVGADLCDWRPNSKTRLRTEEPHERIHPLLHMLRRAIELAFLDATETKNGEPTEDAITAEEWLTARTDWTRVLGCPIPPPELRELYIGSFEWMCSWLGFDPDEVREHGLPRQTCRSTVFRLTSAPRHPQRTRAIRTNSKHSLKHIAGMKAIYTERQRARVAHEARNAPLCAAKAPTAQLSRLDDSEPYPTNNRASIGTIARSALISVAGTEDIARCIDLVSDIMVSTNTRTEGVQCAE